jgi:hypothetical protein
MVNLDGSLPHQKLYGCTKEIQVAVVVAVGY